MSGETIWVMESDVCEDCDALLDSFGCCPNCGWGELDDLYFDDEDEIDTNIYDLDFDEYGRYIGG